MSEPLTIECQVHFQRQARGHKELHAAQTAPRPACEPGRVPRVARRLALAHSFDGLLCSGVVRDCAELARLGRVTRARVSQVMALLQLAPGIQEQVLFLPRTQRGRDPVTRRDLLPVATALNWKVQRRLWGRLAGH
jgi:hypothetical protein